MGKYFTEKPADKSRTLILLLIGITVAAICIAVWAVFFRDPNIVLAPDYAPEESEEHAQIIPDDTSEKMHSEEGGGSVSLIYSNQVAIDLGDRLASLLFANPNKSNHDIILQIVIQEEVIVQSGTIRAGHQVTALNLLDGAAAKLSSGGYDGKFVILYYNPISGEKAIINTEIPIQIEVNG